MMKKPHTLFLLAVLVPLLMVAALLGIFTYQFWHHELAQSSEQWGQFGDYIGGTINPLIAVLNLLALVYIAFEIHNLENAQTKIIEETRRKEETIRLTSEFWTPELRLHFHHIWKRRFEIVPDERLNKEHCPVGHFYRERDFDDKLFRSFVVAIAFYQKMAIMVELKVLDREVCHEIFQPQFERFYSHFVLKGLERLSDVDEAEGWKGGKDRLDKLHVWLSK